MSVGWRTVHVHDPLPEGGKVVPKCRVQYGRSAFLSPAHKLLKRAEGERIELVVPVDARNLVRLKALHYCLEEMVGVHQVLTKSYVMNLLDPCRYVKVSSPQVVIRMVLRIGWDQCHVEEIKMLF